MTDLLAADSQARRDALDVTRSFIVQAPAGSGKTELLIQRYLCLLATVDEPEEVVAITFTRKAANEMQTRVVQALERAAAGATSEKEHEQLTLAAAARILARDRERGWQLLLSPRRMRIQTLDAFCASITRLLPVSSGLGGSMTTTADADMRRLYEEAATATLDWLPEAGPAPDAVSRVLTHLDNDVRVYVAYLARMLAKRDQWLEIVGSGRGDDPERVRAALEDNIAAQVRAALRSLERRLRALGGPAELALLRYSGEQRSTDDAPHPLASLDTADWPPTTPDGAAAWQAITGALITSGGSIRKRITKTEGFPPGDAGEKQAFAAWLEALAAEEGLAELLVKVSELPPPAYDDEQWEILLALFDVLPLAVGELQRLFTSRGVTDHVEVAQAARAALGSVDEPGELAMLMDYRISHLLVDEMQDTSIGQYQLLAQTTAGWEPGDGRTLFCVGDPMQSIYRFRDAEVGQFVAAREHGIGDIALESLVLRRNFRSGEHLVDWFNDVFPGVLPADDDIPSGAVSYSPCASVEAHASAGRVEVHSLVAASQDEEAKRSADVIERCLAEDDGNVAVLVRGRSQLPELLADLRRRGIAAQAIEIDRLTDLPEIIDVLALTRALLHDGDRIAWLALLRAPWCGLSWADLHALTRNDRKRTVRELASEPERLATLGADGRERVQAVLRQLASGERDAATRSLRERVECLWLELGGAAALASAEQVNNVYRYFDALEKLEVAGTVPDVAQLEAMLDDERVSSPGDETTRVQVMTMHKAKGLQFDHVVLHGMARTTRGGDRDVLAWLNVAREDGDSGMIISPLGPRSVQEADPLHRFIERAARDSDQLETGRLLYVACTRAIRSLHLVGNVGTVKQGSELGRPAKSTLLALLWHRLEPQFEAALSAMERPDGAHDDDEAVFTQPVLWRIDRPVTELPSPPPVGEVPPLDTGRAVSYEWVGSAARHAGTIVHRWLELMARGDVPADRLPADRLAVSRRWALSLGVAHDELDDVAQRAADALAAVTTDERGRWLLEGDGHAELRLSGVVDSRVLNVVIDRVRIDDGVHWLVDYKTSSHEGGDLAGFLAEQANRYREQLRCYRDIYRGYCDKPLRTALYFPLLGEFVEVDVDVAL